MSIDSSKTKSLSVDQVEYTLAVPDWETDYIQSKIASSGEPYELAMLRSMAERLDPGDIVIDVGANIGNHSVYLATVVGCEIYAFEPNSHLFEIMEKSIALNGLNSMVHVQSSGVGAATSKARFINENEANLGAQALSTDDHPDATIDVIRLDDSEIPKGIKAIKIDVEGMESDVLEGAEEIIQRDQPLLYIECQGKDDFEPVAEWLVEKNYSYRQSYNATPTHLFIHKNQLKEPDLPSRPLIKLRSDLYDADEKMRQWKTRLEKKNKQYESAEMEHKNTFEELEKEANERRNLQQQLERVTDQYHEVRRQLTAFKSSETYKAGLYLRAASTSVAGAIKLPIRLWRLRKKPGSTYQFRNLLIKLKKRAYHFKKRIQNKKLANQKYDAVGNNEAKVDLDLDIKLAQYLHDNPSLKTTENLLYADITLNVIDGSSVWLSSMSQILASEKNTILLLKEDVREFQLYEGIRSYSGLTIIQPSDFLGENCTNIDQKNAIDCLRILDNYLPSVRNVVVRGLDAALELHRTRQFKFRSFVYLTDFYSYQDRRLVISDDQRIGVKQLSRQVYHFLTQTREIDAKLREISEFDIKTTLLPPPLPEIESAAPPALDEKRIGLVYAGKITPDWGVLELLNWTEKLLKKGYDINLTVIGNKISDANGNGDAFRSLIKKRFAKLGVNHINGASREEVLEHLRSSDYVWCFRPKELEESVLELSTKLLEAVAVGGRALCYPSSINKRLLGEGYPLFITSCEDFEQVISNSEKSNFSELRNLSKQISEDYSISFSSKKLQDVLNATSAQPHKVVFAGHDRKFIDAYYSYLKSIGFDVLFDEWEWGSPKNEDRSEKFLAWADRIFCEWGLANAVWYSNKNIEKKPLFVRLHLQEVNARAKKFGHQIKQENVSKFLVVSEKVRMEAESMFSWEQDASMHIPNFVFDDEFTIADSKFQEENGKLRLGMVGVVPQRKRFDRAIGLLEKLLDRGYDAELFVKGPRPEEYGFMHSGSRSQELPYYKECYERIEKNKLLKGRVRFDPWGNDMPAWYSKIDYVLSPSDFESFHYAVADGILAGCYPLIWPWAEASLIYDESFLVEGLGSAVEKIESFGLMTQKEKSKILNDNRQLIKKRYGFFRVFFDINQAIGLDAK